MAAGLLAKGPVNSPKWVFFLRIAIVVFSVLVLALSAWSVHLHTNPFTHVPNSGSGSRGGTSSGGFSGFSSLSRRQSSWDLLGAALGGGSMGAVSNPYTAAPALNIFAALFSLITHVAVYVFEKWFPHIYFRICIFVSYVLVAIFALSGWAYMASVAALYGPGAEAMRKAYPQGSEQTYPVQLAASTAAGAALGAVLWVLICINTVMFALGCFRTEGESMSSGATELHHVGGKNEASVSVAPAGGPTPVYYASPTPQPQAQPYGVPQQQPYQGYVSPQ